MQKQVSWIIEVLVASVLVSCVFAPVVDATGGVLKSHELSNVSTPRPAGPFASHAPIRINSDADFTPANGVVGGNGTLGDPYRIEGWDIDGTGLGYALYIGNTTEYVIVINNSLHDANGGKGDPFHVDSGLILYHVAHPIIKFNNVSRNKYSGIYSLFTMSGQISDNSVMENFYGIQLFSSNNTNLTNNHVEKADDGLEIDSSANCTISMNSVSSKHTGISLYLSRDNNVANNTAYAMEMGSISIYDSRNILVNNNTITGMRYGIDLSDSKNIKISNNIISVDSGSDINSYNSEYLNLTGNLMDHRGISIFGLTIEKWNSHSIATSNLVGGKPVQYIKNQNYGSIPADAGQVILANATNMTVANLAIKNTSIGIMLGFSSWNKIVNNSVFNSSNYGIYLISSEMNQITNNTLFSDFFAGVFALFSNGTKISGNSALSNIDGFSISQSSFIQIIDNVASENSQSGISASTSYNYVISNNYLWNDSQQGIYIISSEKGLIINNSISNTKIGIASYHSSLNYYSNNMIWNTSIIGFYLLNSSANSINSTDIGKSNRALALYQSSNNNITNNNVSGNSNAGIELDSSSNNNIIYNNITGNSNFGITITNSATSNRIHHNNLINNHAGGKQGHDSVDGNSWNDTTVGNHWSDFDEPSEGCYDNDTNGICDAPYVLEGGVGARDYYPFSVTKSKVHAPIRINRDADFTSANGVIGGSGTKSDPFVIAGWDINGIGYGYALYIGNTTKHFIVRANYLHDASGNGNVYFWDACLTLYNATNGMAEKNTASNHCWFGINLYYGENSSLANNNVSGTDFGISLHYSAGNTITSNNVSSNYEDGIRLSESDNNTITNNNASSNKDGIFLSNSCSNTLTNNNVSDNRWSGIHLYRDGNALINNNASGNGLYGINLDHSNNNTLTRNTASSNSDYGLYLNSSDSNALLNNNASGNGLASIKLWNSDNNILTNNNASGNDQNGIDLGYSNYNAIRWNSIAFNLKYGIKFDTPSYATMNRIDHNAFINNNGGAVQAYDGNGSNYWNTTLEGNHWSDFDESSEGCIDANSDGICDSPYLIDGGSGAKDNYPLVKASLPQPPGVVSCDPSDNASGVAIGTKIVVTFSKSMDRNSTGRAVSSSPSFTWDSSWSSQDRVLTLLPSKLLQYGTAYTITISVDATSADGLKLAKNYSFKFTTIPAVSPPPSGDTITAIIVSVGIVIAAVAIAAILSIEWIFYGLALFLLPLYMRIKKEQVLDHFLRGQIFEFIRANPGTHLRMILRELKIPMGVLCHHLSVLEKNGMVRSENSIYLKKYYRIPKLKSDNGFTLKSLHQKIIDEVKIKPGFTAISLSKKLGIKHLKMIDNLRILSEMGYLEPRHTSHGVRYYPGRNDEKNGEVTPKPIRD